MPLMVGQRIKPLIFDFNQDGKQDILVGNKRGGISAFSLKMITQIATTAGSELLTIMPNPVKNQLSIKNMRPSSVVSIHHTSGQLVFYSTSHRIR